MSEDLEKAQNIFLGKVNQICAKFGLNNIMAQLYTILYLHGKRMSLDEMVKQLKISKGSVSTNIRALERYGAVRKIWIRGSRKDYYEAEPDISKVIMDRVKSMAQNRLRDMDDMINSSYHALNSVNSSNKKEKEAIKTFKQRLDKLKALHNKAQSIFNLFNSGLMRNMLSNRKIISKKETSLKGIT